MRRTLALSSALVVALLVLAGCSSVPKPSSADDCLVLIRTEFNNSTTYPVMRKYRIGLSTGGQTIQVPTIKSSYITIVLKEPGVVINSITSDVNDASAYGDSSKGKAKIELPYKPGFAVVADFCIVQQMKYGDTPNSFTSGLNLRKIEQFEKDELLQSLRDGNKLEGWSM